MAVRKYDWELWFARDKTTLLRGVDYHCSQSTMSQIIRNNASKYGVGVKLIDNGNSITVRVVDAISYPDRITITPQHPAPLA